MRPSASVLAGTIKVYPSVGQITGNVARPHNVNHKDPGDVSAGALRQVCCPDGVVSGVSFVQSASHPHELLIGSPRVLMHAVLDCCVRHLSSEQFLAGLMNFSKAYRYCR